MNNTDMETSMGASAPKSARPRRKWWKVALLVVLAAVVLLAVRKNPSEREAKALVKESLVEVVENKLRQEMDSDRYGLLGQMGAALGLIVAPELVDNFVDVKVTDFLLFSTFDASVSLAGQTRNGGGLIVFGRLIPLYSDIDF